MPRRKKENPYQLPLELDWSRKEPTAAYRAILDGLSTDPEARRFVREVAPDQRVTVRTPADAANYLINHVYIPFKQFDQEEVWVLILDRKNRIRYEAMVYRGTVDAVHLRVSEMFKEAVRVNAPSIIMSHCHPSGDPSPSPEDVRFTELLVEAGKILDIGVLDHLVIGDNNWVSLKERKLGFK